MSAHTESFASTDEEFDDDLGAYPSSEDDFGYLMGDGFVLTAAGGSSCSCTSTTSAVATS